MYYTIYKTTNLINQKIYIGKHQTENPNDDYFGSGKHLTKSIKKHGKETFHKEILFIFDTELEMNQKEAELVNEEFCLRKDTYNLCPGGKGGWGYVAKLPRTESWCKAMSIGIKGRKKTSDEEKIKCSLRMKELHKNGKIKYDTFTGKKHSDETKKKIGTLNSKSQSGSGNSQYGLQWITNGILSKKIKKNDPILEGWVKGRKV